MRGEIVLRAVQIREELKRDAQLKRAASFPFDRLVECNIGNPQALRQQPLSFNRQVLALMTMPDMLNWPDAEERFAPDAVERAREYLSHIPEGLGAYSESQGFRIVREQVARFIKARDEGVGASPDDIFLTDGASKGVQLLLKMILCDAMHGALVPIPQYPLYSASLALDSCQMLGYELSEKDDWSLPVAKLESSINAARAKGVQVRVLVVINPGNPTGNSLPLENMRDIIRFCANENLVLMADEVYQENVYREGLKFHSFKKVLRQMPEGEPPLQLVSFHSTSKGFLGECGLRGGYFELYGFDADVQAQLLKLASIGLCSNTVGQVATGLMVQPPKRGDASFAKYEAERDGILTSLKRRATKLVNALNALPGISCNEPQGAMYVFPSIDLPKKAMDAAARTGKASAAHAPHASCPPAPA